MSNDILIVSFAGHGQAYGGIPKIEFGNFLRNNFPNIDAQFYLDVQCKCYHGGIQGISTNIEETRDYLRKRFDGYKRVVCVGASGGGYAAILFGSLLEVDTVIAFNPQTILKGKDKDVKYCDLNTFINPDTKYYIFGDESVTDASNCHHISQCENIEHHTNVKLIRKTKINLKLMRNSGELFTIFINVINGRDTDHPRFSNRVFGYKGLTFRI